MANRAVEEPGDCSLIKKGFEVPSDWTIVNRATDDATVRVEFDSGVVDLSTAGRWAKTGIALGGRREGVSFYLQVSSRSRHTTGIKIACEESDDGESCTWWNVELTRHEQGGISKILGITGIDGPCIRVFGFTLVFFLNIRNQ